MFHIECPHTDFDWRRQFASFNVQSMTIIAAAVCREAKAIVLAGDRCLTAGTEDDTFQFDIFTPKIKFLAGVGAIGIAGSAHEAMPIYEAVKDCPIGDVQGKVSSLRKQLRNKKIEEFRSENPRDRDLPAEQIIKRLGWSLSFLVAGVAGDRFYLSTVGEQDFENPDLGFNAIGSGCSKAISAFSRRPRLQSYNLSRVAYATYEAKRDAELSWGVGKGTDLVILQEKLGLVLLSEDDLKPFEAAYRQMRPVDFPLDLLTPVDDLLKARGRASC